MLHTHLVTARRFAFSAVLVAVAAMVVALLAGFALLRPVWKGSATIQTQLVGSESGDTRHDLASSTELISTAQTLLQSPRVMGPAGAKLDPPVSAAVLANRVELSAPPTSLVMVLQTSAASTSEAEATVRAVAEQFREELDAVPLRSSDGRVTLEWRSADYHVEPDATAQVGVAQRAGSAALAGVLVGLAYLIARVALDTTVRSHRHVADITDDSIVAVIDPEPTPAQADLLAGAMRFLIPRDVTQPVIGIAAITDARRSAALVQALGDALRRQGNDALVVDADLRGAPLGNAQEGFVDMLLGGDASPRDGVLMAGQTPPNAMELLAGADWDAVTASLRHDGVTLVNCAPLARTSDGAVVASRCDAVLLVVAEDRDRRGDLAEARALLAALDTQVTGIVYESSRPVKAASPYDVGAAALGR